MATVAERRARPASQAWYRSKQGRETVKHVIAFIVLVAIGLLFVAPFLWMLSTSLKPALYVFTQGWIPHPFVWQNYYDALTSAPFDVYFRNTILITTLSVVGAVLSSSLVAYSFARLKWPGRDVLFGIVLATMILPSIVTLIPQYILFAKIGWVNTFLPLIVPVWLGGSAFYIFLLRQFYRGIPMELSEAARIDGASELRIWWQIVQPLARPALAAVAIFSFNGAWEDYSTVVICAGRRTLLPCKARTMCHERETLRCNCLLSRPPRWSARTPQRFGTCSGTGGSSPTLSIISRG